MNIENSKIITLAGKKVGDGQLPYLIAEIGQNHNGDIELAKELIKMAVQCGVNAVKFQKRDIQSELTSKAYNALYDNPNSFGATYGKHREYLEFDENQHSELKKYAESLNITYFCTVCDIPSLEMMERLDVPFYKVASRDLTNIPLIEALGKLGKPIIISTGMATYEDIDDALLTLNLPFDKLIIMHCTSEYPCKPENANLNVINTLRNKYGYLVGYSDHTSGVIVSSVSTVLGACIIENHITLDRSMKGTDQAGSLERSGLMKLSEYISTINKALGNPEKQFIDNVEQSKIKLGRSLTSIMNIDVGTILTEEMICLKSPGDGILWRNRNKVIGKRAIRKINKNSTIILEDFTDV